MCPLNFFALKMLFLATFDVQNASVADLTRPVDSGRTKALNKERFIQLAACEP